MPAGSTRYDGTKLGFAIALAPGWKEASSDPGSGASFAGPAGLAMLVHFEQSVSTDLDTATGAVLFDLTGGSGVVGSRVTAATLAERRAKRVAGRFSGPGAVAAIDAYVMVESGRAWAVALAGPPDAVDHSRDDFRLLAYDDDGHIARAYGLLGPPTTFFVDKDHVLRHVVIGPLTAGTLDAGLRAAGAA